jgi:hypothetical protein
VKRSYALSKCVEDGVNHMFPVSVLQRNDSVRCPVYTSSEISLSSCGARSRRKPIAVVRARARVCVFVCVCVCGRHSIEPALTIHRFDLYASSPPPHPLLSLSLADCFYLRRGGDDGATSEDGAVL